MNQRFSSSPLEDPQKLPADRGAEANAESSSRAVKSLGDGAENLVEMQGSSVIRRERLSIRESDETAESEEAPSAADEDMTYRLRRVDYLLKSAAMLAPSSGFAERVLHALQEQSKNLSWRRSTGTGIILGLSLGTLYMLLIGLLALTGIILAIINRATVQSSMEYAATALRNRLGAPMLSLELALIAGVFFALGISGVLSWGILQLRLLLFPKAK